MLLILATILLGGCILSRSNEVASLELISDRLRMRNEASLPQCTKSQWMANYTALHARILSSPSPDIIVSVPFLSGKMLS
jgi:hypothetical protein